MPDISKPSSKNLLYCPCCHADHVRYEYENRENYTDGWRVVCIDCGLGTAEWATKEKAKDMWQGSR